MVTTLLLESGIIPEGSKEWVFMAGIAFILLIGTLYFSVEEDNKENKDKDKDKL